MEWLVMDPSRGKAFTENLCRSPSFRAKFGGLYASVTSALARLGATELPVPSFIQDKIASINKITYKSSTINLKPKNFNVTFFILII